MPTIQAEVDDIRSHSADLRKELGLADLTLTQVLFIVGLPWVGVAAKQGPAHVIFWTLAIVFFYLPSAAVVIHLNRQMPLEGGLYQWAKIGFNEVTGFMVAWNLWLFAILITSETGLQVTQYFAYIAGGNAFWANPWVIGAANVLILGALTIVTIRGLSVGKWVHKAGGALMLVVFAMLIALPWLNVAHGTLHAYHPLQTAVPAISILSLNIAAKMGFGAFGGFEYVAIHAGECRNPSRTIARSVALAAPIIGVMFVLGTSSVLAFIPIDRLDLIAPIPQVLSAGFDALGGGAAIVVPLTIFAFAIIRLAQSSVQFAGQTRLPMVAGWDALLPAWFTRLHPRYHTPVNSILCVGAVTLAFSLAGIVGVGKQEAFQLLWNAGGIFYALTYLVMFLIPIFGVPSPLWLKIASASGFLTTLGYVMLSILPIVDVQSVLSFALKISSVIVITNAIGFAIFVMRTRRVGRTGRAGATS